MKKFMYRFTFCFVFLLTAFVSQSKENPFSDKPIPYGFGYNIHFTDAKPGEMEMIADSGATILRMDLSWGATEKEKGVYDFSAFERLTNVCEKHGIRPLYILDYSNRHYDEGLSPYSDEGRKAFADWAAAAVKKFQGRGILWEMYNEPNIHFWKPKPNIDHYIALSNAVGKAIRDVAPNEAYFGPATSEIPLDFLEKCFQGGTLEYWDAVSVHPYRQKAPETAALEYAKLRHLIDKYAPKDKNIPILSAEWGYSSVWNNYNDEIQGKMLPRQWLMNAANRIPVSIWYDWHNDGTDPKEAEHNFGTTYFQEHKGRKPPYDPKPSYIAAKTFNETFNGFRFNKRLCFAGAQSTDNEFVYLFNNGDDLKFAVWTTGKESKTITIPGAVGEFSVVDYLGEKQPDLTAAGAGLIVTISDGPLYLTPRQKQPVFEKFISQPTYPDYVLQSEKFPSKENIPGVSALKMSRYNPEPVKLTFPLSESPKIWQQTHVHSANPLRITGPVLSESELTFSFDNSSGEPYSGSLNLTASFEGGEKRIRTLPVKINEGEKSAAVKLPMNMATFKSHFGKSFLLEGTLASDENTPNWTLPKIRLRLHDDFSKYTSETLNKDWKMHAEGDANVECKQELSLENGMLKASYSFGEGWRYLCIALQNELRKIPGKPKSFSVMIEGDGSGNTVRLRFRDSQGQTFQSDGGKLDDTSKKTFVFSLEKSNGHWGGANDGVVRHPVELDALIIDSTRKATGPNAVRFSYPVIYWNIQM